MNVPPGKERKFSYKKLSPYIVLIICLLITVYSYYFYSNHLKEKATTRFTNLINETTSAISERLYDYNTILRGGVALFAAQGEVSRDQWRIYVENLRVWKNYPGIQGIGFSKLIQPSELQAHIAKIRAEGSPNYTVRPEGKRTEYTSIIYLEPFDKRNQRAFGYDMFSESVRRAAMERARDTDMASMSGKVKLLQETETDVQPGFLMYVAVYKKGMPVSSVQERKAALLGYVYSPFRIRDLMKGIAIEELKDINLEIYDGVDVSENSLMYASSENKYALSRSKQRLFTDKKVIDLYGHQWSLFYSASPAFEITSEKHLPLAILVLGIIISFLIFLLMQSQERTRKQAVAIANDMTAALRESEQKYRVLNDTLPVGVSIIGPNMEILAVNLTKRKWFPESDYGQHPTCYANYNLPPRTEPCQGCPVVKTFQDGQTHTAEREANTLQGTRSLLITTAPLTGPDGKVISVHETVEDITERKKAEEELRRVNRALMTISECNKALVHSTDEQTLLNEICKVIVTIGGYRLALVGYAEHDEKKTVRPVAYAGYNEGFLEGLHVTWADTEYGRGPSGTAICTNRPAVFNDISTD
ncbi:MAG: CHASE domain-containing protein, partial [Proteobacteria bacterium]|nr:CHASE domain-containing protein [Pseudomonadota bacterium]